jgi:hypothetical protein
MKRIFLNIFKKTIPFFALAFFIWLGVKRTDGFRQNLITTFKSYDKKWDIELTTDINEIRDILSKKFHYLTRGRECFIFESDDEKYVIKFFDSSRYDAKLFKPYIPLPKILENYRKKHYNRRSTKLNFNLSSAKIAYERLKEDAALIHVNLTKTDIFSKKIHITNKYGKQLFLDLNNIFFILQKKCDLFYREYENINDDEYKKYLLTSFLEMAHRRTLKLVIDDDIGKKRRNWGLLNNKAVTFDIGRWYHDEKLQTLEGYKKEMIKATKIFRKYLSDNEPEKLDFVNQMLEEYFKAFNEKVSK